MTYPLENVKSLEINPKSILVTYKDGTKMTINIPNWTETTRDQNTGEVIHKHNNTITFNIDSLEPPTEQEWCH